MQNIKLVNINGDEENKDYEYKMVKPEFIYDKINKYYAFINVVDFCSENLGINRRVIYIKKFLIDYFKCKWQFNNINKVLYTYTKIDNLDFNNAIKDFINKYIFCKSCGKPKTYIILENKINKIICKECNYKIDLFI
jgi:translation initiation factor 2 beta subunit (eIF-2beta)/eIF-5